MSNVAWHAYATAAGRKAAAAKDAAMVAEIVAHQKLTITPVPLFKVSQAAIKVWEDHNGLSFDPRRADPEIPTRLALNYIRHNLTNYDAMLNRIDEHGGGDEDKNKLRGKFYRLIEKFYPALTKACATQLARRQGV